MRPQSVSYEPKKGANPDAVWENIDSTTSDVKTCTNVATWVDPKTGIHYCDRCKIISQTSDREEYGEYTSTPGDPCDEPIDPEFGSGGGMGD
jgi:hypothetical protein